jgi:predicted amidophosphoribosyltransferase
MTPCPKCARQNADDALYCDQCRTAVSPAAPAPVQPDPCPACGGEVREVPSVLALCAGCGLALGEAAAEGGHAPERPAPSAPVPAPEPGETASCPLCGEGNPAGAPQCGGCGLAFEKPRGGRTCPKCEAESSEDQCSCGAILTLAKLLEYVDPSVRVVCSVCKQPFTVERGECSDCGGETLPADALKKLAASR